MGKWERSLWIIAVVVLLSALVGGGLGSRCDADSSSDNSIELFIEIMNSVNEHYVEKPDFKKLINGAIDGMLRSLDDQHTYFMDEEKHKAFQVEIKGKFFGIGIEITMKNNILTVVSPIEGTPAYRAGLKPNDRIIKINGESTIDKTIVDAVNKIRGERGTTVTLTIDRDGLSEPFDVEIARDEIKIQSIADMMLDNNIGYIRLKRFDMESAVELAGKLNEYKQKGMKALIFDLRGNPGGLLTAAVQIADYFISDGILVSTKGRNNNENLIHNASQKSTIVDNNLPVYLLINEGSASASEIVAGALKDHKRAITLGEKSFGKASVQKLFYYKGGTQALRLTIAKYYTPSGNLIHGKGIIPDIIVTPLTFQKSENESLKKYAKNKLIKKFLTQHPNPKYNQQTKSLFNQFLKSNDAPMSMTTSSYLLKRELTLKAPVVDLEFDNQLQEAIRRIRKTIK